MFCDRCGTQVAGTAKFCSSCGKPFQIWTPRATMGRVSAHVRSLGMFWLVYSAIRLLGGIFFPISFFMPHFFHVAGGMMSVWGALGLLTGWGLLERLPWARTVAIVLAFFTLFSFGLGTVLGIYTLWVLLPSESAREYEQGTRTA